MSDPVGRRTATRPTDRENWILVAERVYSFERRTAQRLAFIRWLRLSGRLSDGSPSPQEAEAARAAAERRVQQLRGPWPSWK